MSIVKSFFNLAGKTGKGLRIFCNSALNAVAASEIRSCIENLQYQKPPAVFIDASQVASVDLAGINEIIRSHYVLRPSGTELVLIYRRQSVLEKWVENTGLHSFINTAMLPRA